MQNQRTPKNNTSGTMGVFFDKSKKTNPWRVELRNAYCGVFATKEEAIAEAMRIAALPHRG